MVILCIILWRKKMQTNVQNIITEDLDEDYIAFNVNGFPMKHTKTLNFGKSICRFQNVPKQVVHRNHQCTQNKPLNNLYPRGFGTNLNLPESCNRLWWWNEFHLGSMHHTVLLVPYFSRLFHLIGDRRGRVCYSARQPIRQQLDLVSTSMFWWESGFGTRTMRDFNSCFFPKIYKIYKLVFLR